MQKIKFFSKRIAKASCLVVALGLAFQFAQAQTQSSPSATPAPNPYEQALIKAGAPSCAARANQVSQFIAGDSQAGAYFFAPSAPADKQLLSFSFELQPGNGQTVYASASFAPNQANGCGAEYEAVVYWPKVCEAVASEQYKDLKPLQPLRKDIRVLAGAAGARVFLMPAGTGCIAIKKEVVR